MRMWVAEFRMWHESLMLEVTRKYDVAFHSYYLNWFVEKGRHWINKAIIVTGKDGEAALRELSKDPRAKVFFLKGRQMFYAVEELASFHASVLHKSVFPLKPQYVEKGFEYWTLASTHKKALLELMRKINRTPKAGIELLALRKQDPHFFPQGVFGELTELQRDAVLAAFREGYYEYPRKTSVKKLARKRQAPRTTFLEHLRKAESKIMPSVLQSFE